MGLFNRKKKDNEYDVASQNLNEEVSLAKDRLILEQIEDDDQRARDLVKELKNGHPLILNFEKLPNIAANKMLAFFTGAVVALDGHAVMINDFTFLFARKVDFQDGSLQDFIDEI